MTSKIQVAPFGPDDWERVREIRLASLQANPEAFGAKFETESIRPERFWRARLSVWVDNYSAIKAYELIGFENIGDPQPSTSQPGKFYQRMRRTTPAKGN